MDRIEMDASLHGAEVKGSRRKRRRERKKMKDASPSELESVGIISG